MIKAPHTQQQTHNFIHHAHTQIKTPKIVLAPLKSFLFQTDTKNCLNYVAFKCKVCTIVFVEQYNNVRLNKKDQVMSTKCEANAMKQLDFDKLRY